MSFEGDESQNKSLDVPVLLEVKIVPMHWIGNMDTREEISVWPEIMKNYRKRNLTRVGKHATNRWLKLQPHKFSCCFLWHVCDFKDWLQDTW